MLQSYTGGVCCFLFSFIISNLVLLDGMGNIIGTDGADESDIGIGSWNMGGMSCDVALHGFLVWLLHGFPSFASVRCTSRFMGPGSS